MPNEMNRIVIRERPPTIMQNSEGTTSAWRHPAVIAKTIVVALLSMGLLGAEIELRISPQIDTILIVGVIGVIWAWL